jgi:hypothetical protein
MPDDAVTVTIPDALLRTLAVDLSRLLAPIGVGVATATQDRIAPYPPAPAPRNPRRFYRRGTGSVSVRRDGSESVRRTSQALGRRWETVPHPGVGATLRNPTTYSGYVHRKDLQTAQHAATGWVTDVDASRAVESDGTAERIAEAVVKQAMGI